MFNVKIALSHLETVHNHSCCAIAYANGNIYEYKKIFAPYLVNGVVNSNYWLDRAREQGYIRKSEMLEWRRTAVCLYAAMREAGDV